jgi:hypothetical protein
LKRLTQENLTKDNACAAGIRYWRTHNAPEIPDSDWIKAILNDDSSYWTWCAQHGYEGFTALPEGLSVGGYLDLRGTQITALPEGLSVGGYLDLSGTQITKGAVPAHLKKKVVF